MRLNDDVLGPVLRSWHKDLLNCKGDAARLRRCVDTQQVVMTGTPVLVDLYNALKSRGMQIDAHKLASVIGILAHVKKDIPCKGGIARQMGDGKRISELRFRRLTSAQDPYATMRRIVHQLGGECDVASLADTLYRWGSEKMMTNLVINYYNHQDEDKQK